MPKAQREEVIYNCHIHTFTIDNVPDNYIPKALTKPMQVKWLRKIIVKALSIVDPLNKRDFFERYAQFMDISSNNKQSNIFKIVQAYYPPETKFVVMPMDMTQMGSGKVPQDIDAQHKELAKLTKAAKGAIIPFAAIDPRRANLNTVLNNLITGKGYDGVKFAGFKLYPPLGYKPGNKELEPVFEFANEHSLPITAHCSRGGVRHSDFKKKDANKFSDPHNYVKVLEKYPKMRLCLAHFGGEEEWRKYLEHPSKGDNWLYRIRQMMLAHKNLYADISYSIFSYEDNAPILKVLLQDKTIRERVLFGSDYYMAEKEKYAEKRLSITLRAMLDEDLFWQISNVNPKKFLGIK